MKSRRILAAPTKGQVRGPGRADGLLHSLLKDCSLSHLERFISDKGAQLAVRNNLPLSDRRLINAAQAIARADGRTITLDHQHSRASHQIWAVAHCFAHMIQWHTPRASHIHPAFCVGGDEAQLCSATPLETARGQRLGRAVRQELEAHLLTASVLAACYDNRSRAELSEMAMVKAYSDLIFLSRPSGRGRSSSSVIWRALRRFNRDVPEAPYLGAMPSFKRLRGHFIPYLLFSR